jgi:hypothetical protein
VVGRNPELITTDRWDLSKIFYDTRTSLDKNGYDTTPMNEPARRKAIHNDVKDSLKPSKCVTSVTIVTPEDQRCGYVTRSR